MKRRCDICGRLRPVQALLVRRTYLGVKLTRPFYICRYVKSCNIRKKS